MHICGLQLPVAARLRPTLTGHRYGTLPSRDQRLAGRERLRQRGNHAFFRNRRCIHDMTPTGARMPAATKCHAHFANVNFVSARAHGDTHPTSFGVRQ